MESQPLTLKIAGPAGLGIKTLGQFLSRLLIAHGQSVSDYSEYPSLVRGGHNTFQITFSPKPVLAPYSSVDYFLSIAPNHWQVHQSEFHSHTLVLADTVNSSDSLSKGQLISLPFDQLRSQLSAPIYLNSLYAGLVGFILNFNPQLVSQIITQTFVNSSSQNLAAYQLGFDYAQKNLASYQTCLTISSKRKSPLYLDGNEAFAQGLIDGGCRFYAAYPMTPATGVLHYLAAKSATSNMVVVHPEDEIAAANMAAGAAFAGVLSATGTSGGGFALMNEAVSFCGVAELGVVFYLVSRPGPATGLPTWTSQGDLLHAIYSGHGEFPKIVIAPSDHTDSYQLAAQALTLAHHYQLPVIVVSDKFLAESGGIINRLPRLTPVSPRSFSPPGVNYQRYSLNSPPVEISAPGDPGGEYLCNSYEHDPWGWSTEDSGMIEKMQQRRQSKLKSRHFFPSDLFFGEGDSSNLVVSWGSTKGPILEALKLGTKKPWHLLHLRSLWPLNPKLKTLISSYSQIVTIENSLNSQLTALLKSYFDFSPQASFLKPNGRPFFPEEINQWLNHLRYRQVTRLVDQRHSEVSSG